MHTKTHPLTGKFVRLRGEDVPRTPLQVEDWLDRIDYDAGIAYASRAALNALWDETREGDAHVVMGHIGSLAVIAHHKELGPVEAKYDPWSDIETD